MAEYVGTGNELVSLNQPIIFNASIPCTRGNIYHEDGTGIFTLSGKTQNCFARYQILYNGNIAIPEGGTVGPIGVAIAVNGEEKPFTRAIATPAAVEEYANATCIAVVSVPRGCCFSVSVRSVPATSDPAAVPAPVIAVQDSNLTITRIA
jgi:hypothetical protein